MNWSVDWSWWAVDPRQVEMSNRLQAFFASQGMADYQSLYTLDGKPLGGGQTTGLVATNAVASLAADHPRRLAFVRAVGTPGAERPAPLLRRHALHDGPAPLQRPIPRLTWLPAETAAAPARSGNR